MKLDKFNIKFRFSGLFLISKGQNGPKKSEKRNFMLNLSSFTNVVLPDSNHGPPALTTFLNFEVRKPRF